MAEYATPSGAAMATVDAGIDKKKPEKPDEDLFNKNLKQAEKDHADTMVKLVFNITFLYQLSLFSRYSRMRPY